MGFWNLPNTFSTLAGNQPASTLDANFDALAIVPQYATAVSGTNAIALTVPLTFSSYAIGMRFTFMAAGTNTGPATLNVNGVGAINIVKDNNLTLVGGEILSGTVVECYYDGINFHYINVRPSMVLLNRTVASGASAVSWGSSVFTSAYGRWYLQITNMSFSTTADFLMQFSTDNGATWVNTGNVYARYGTTAQTATGTNVQNVSATNDSSISFGTGFTTAYRVSADIFIDIVNQSMIRVSQSWFASGVQQGATTGMGGISSVANAFRITTNTGTISGTFAIYGIRNS
jgi:hypothetical protein